jgi:hypothetical protein
LFEKQSRAMAAGDIILIFPIIRVGHGFSRIYFQTAALLPYIGNIKLQRTKKKFTCKKRRLKKQKDFFFSVFFLSGNFPNKKPLELNG